MKDADALLEQTGETVEYLKIYAQQQVDIVKLEAIEKSAKLGSSFMTAFIVSVMGMIAILLLTISIAFFLGQMLDNTALGFLITSLFYAVMGLLSYFFRKTLITSPLVSYFISKIYEEN